MTSSPEQFRQTILAQTQNVIIKVGTNVLAQADDSINQERIDSLASSICRIHNSGRRVILVSSGAVGVGMGILRLDQKPNNLPHLQASAAVGQAKLIGLYDRAFQRDGLHAAQVLLTGSDFKARDRYLNARNTFSTLSEYPVIPVVNQNDTTSTSEIQVGDNDRLAALVTSIVPNSLLIILTSVEGLLDGPPNHPESRRVPLVRDWDEKLRSLATAERSLRGTGGMDSKLDAVRMATSIGENVIIADGRSHETLDQIFVGDDIGTLFLADETAVPAWKRWIGLAIPPKGRFILDDGACGAVQKSGKSLLPIGVVSVEGDFERGDVVLLTDSRGREIARGLSNYSSREARIITGVKTGDISSHLPTAPYNELVHRDNLLLSADAPSV